MEIDQTMASTAASPVQSKQVYLMAVICLSLGLAIGYFSRGSLSAEASQIQRTANIAPAGIPHNSMHSQRMPSLEQMKHMADKQAEPVLEKLKADPNNPVLLAQAAATYHAAHQFKEAAAYYDKAVQFDQKNVTYRSKLASSLYRSGEVDAAIAQLDKALSYEPQDPNSLFNLGMIKLEGKHDSKGAIAAWQKLLKTNPQLSPEKKAMVTQLMAQVLTTETGGKPKQGAAREQ